MGLEKKFRTYTEKTTSIEQPIEVVQYGRFITRISSSGAGTLAVILPTTIPNVKSVKITHLSASSSLFDKYYCDLNLYTATHAIVSSALSVNRQITNNVAASMSQETVFAFDNTTGTKYLYESQQSASKTTLSRIHPAGASGAVSYNETYWKKNITIASNGKNYLKVLGRNAALSVSSKTLNGVVLAYEVRGYE